jgi:putative SOS response-associated peptidase YedK
MASWAQVHEWLRLATFADLPPSYNVAPTQQVAVARELEGRREGVAMRWGLIPSWAKDRKTPFINARADSAATKPAFRSAFKKRRCLVLANGYYEWKKGAKQKQPFYYRLADDKPFTFAGLWETWRGEGESVDSCAILTTDANELAKDVHDRMPVILTGNNALAWIDPAIDDPKALTDMLQPFDAKKMTCYPVNPMVGNVKNNSPECIRSMLS